MTPERLQEIRADVAAGYAGSGDRGVRQFTAALGDLEALLDYIDLLHEDLRLTREERDAEKKYSLRLRKDNADLERRIDALIRQTMNQADEIQEQREALAQQSRDHTTEVLAWDALAVDTRAKAWDEGYEDGLIDGDPAIQSKIERGVASATPNPYRKDTE